MTFAGIVVAQAGNVLACRTSKQSIFKTSLKTNKWIIVGIISQLSILAVPSVCAVDAAVLRNHRFRLHGLVVSVGISVGCDCC